MIKSPADATRKRYQPTGRQLFVAGLKGAGMGALVVMVLVKVF